MMHGDEKSDSAIVAVKPANKMANAAAEQSAGAPAVAEPVEPRAGISSASRTWPRRDSELAVVCVEAGFGRGW
jgi:hypothetical protein